MSQVHVAVAVIVDEQQVLISLRKPEQHQGNLWEFPGGKVEQGETVLDALQREVKEELAIQIHHASPLMEISHQYSDKSVLLDIWTVTDFSGLPQGQEGQEVKWCPIPSLDAYPFPAANQAIINTLQQHYLEQVSS